jgi:uncharacterized protein (TIGR02271 family)
MTRAPMSQLEDWQLKDDAQDIRGWPVRDSSGAAVGRVHELIGNTDTGYVDTIMLDDGREVPVESVRQRGREVVLADTGRHAVQEGDDTTMTLSQERLRVSAERVPVGKIRLSKRVVSENVSQQVPLSREEIRLEREPVAPTEGIGYRDQKLGDEDVEITLTADRPVIHKEAVPVERVRVTKKTVTENASVTDTVRHEEAELGEREH